MLPAGAPLSDWLTWLESLSPREIDLGLDRVQAVLDRLGLERPMHVLLVGGTNGKGSSVAMATALLRAAGYRTGAYTSPHISAYNERIVVGDAPVSDAQIIAAFEQVEAVRLDVPLTYFEFGTLAAMVVFASAELDVWILEVGMGGRLDATNVIDPTASLITNVSLDHCDWLGEDIETIAYEKAGIMREGVPTVFSAPQVPTAIMSQAASTGADLRLRPRDYTWSRRDGGEWTWRGRRFELASLPPPGLPGVFQYGNAAAVLALLEAAGLDRVFDAGLVSAVLPTVTLAGRLQRIAAGGARWLLDVAHNPAAAAVLAMDLESSGPVDAETWAIIGLLDDKDIEGIATELDRTVDLWIAVTAVSGRAVDAAELARRIANCCNRPCLVGDSVETAMDLARRSVSGNGRIVVTGSFFLVGPALGALELYSRPES